MGPFKVEDGEARRRRQRGGFSRRCSRSDMFASVNASVQVDALPIVASVAVKVKITLM
jgi:hypothetical protein